MGSFYLDFTIDISAAVSGPGPPAGSVVIAGAVLRSSQVNSQVKSSSGATRPRGELPDPNLLLPSSLRGFWRGLVEVGR